MQVGMVYILKSAAWVADGRPFCKLGMTNSPTMESVERRRRSMQTGVPLKVEVQFAGAVKNPKEMEAGIHAHFAGARCLAGGGTEFFLVTPAMAEAYYRSLGIKAGSATPGQLAATASSDLLGIRVFMGALWVISSLLTLMFIGASDPFDYGTAFGLIALWAAVFGGYAILPPSCRTVVNYILIAVLAATAAASLAGKGRRRRRW